jgi:hypothetical protein
VLAFACGGETAPSADAGSASSSGGDGGSSSGSELVDAAPTIDSSSPMACTSNGVDASSFGEETDSGPPPCDISTSETCNDGNTYHVSCQCPSATCVCYVTTSSSGGSGGGGTSYPGCPSCMQSSGLYALCDFPQ